MDMVRPIKLPVDPREIGKAFAHSSDWEQAELLNKMGQELRVACKDMNLDGTQCCYISDKLDSNGILLINSLAEFIKLREKSRPV